MIVYQCEDSMEGVFTAICCAYEEGRRPKETRVSLTDELFLFAESVLVETDLQKARRVSEGLRKVFGEDDYFRICMALTSPDPEKGQAVYQTVAAGLQGRRERGHLFDDLSDEYVRQAFAMARAAGREYDHLRGFLRFQETAQKGLLCASIGPKNQILSFLMSHFADRFPEENFVIFDVNRKLAGIHPMERQRKRADEITWFLARGEEIPDGMARLGLSDREEFYQELFTYFCHKIAIRERRNPELQKRMLPLRFREYMTEFQRRTGMTDS